MKAGSTLNDTNSTISITGIGLAACLGLDAQTVWTRIRGGACGIGPMSAMESPLPPGKDGGQAPDLPAEFHPELPREARYLRWTIEAALRDAGVGETYPSDRRAILLGTTLHGMRAGGRFLRSNDYGDLSTFLAGDTLRLAADGLNLHGMAATTCSACSSSLGAVALAVTLLERGDYDLIIAGGYDTISEYVWAGFNSLRLVSDPPLRPFARGRCGMKVAEGYGIVVLERQVDAVRRGARTLATVAGWGESADAFHLTRPEPTGAGALAAMKQALQRALVSPADLDLIAAHATGTPDNDSSEAAAIIALCGTHRPPVVGFKSHLGHTLGGAGAVELICSALAIRDGVIPPTANCVTDEIEYRNVNVTQGRERSAPVRYTLNTSLGFGGANTCVVLAEPKSASTPTLRARRKFSESADVLITGVGVLIPGAIGNDAFAAYVREGREPQGKTIDDAEFEHLVANARRMRRMSPYVKLSLCAATLACRDAGVLDDAGWLGGAGAILGTTHGSAGYSFDYYSQLVREGIAAANPMLFAEGVPNAAAAQLSLMLGLRGACQTIIGTETAGLDALRLAAARIAAGEADRLIVCAAEESHFTLDEAYAHCASGLPRERTQSVSCAAAFILETSKSAAARGRSSASSWTALVGSTSSFGVRRERSTQDSSHTIPLRGHGFSVAPMLRLAAMLIDRDRMPAEFDIMASDRNRYATQLRFIHHAAAIPPVSSAAGAAERD